MAMMLTAEKGGFKITNGYLIITQTSMQKYLKPETVFVTVDNGDGTTRDEATTVPTNAVMYIARGQVYPSQQARESQFGATELNFAFSFDHVDGKDPVQEAYESVRVNGLPGWVLTGIVDA
jgi:hypothetical protein